MYQAGLYGGRSSQNSRRNRFEAIGAHGVKEVRSKGEPDRAETDESERVVPVASNILEDLKGDETEECPCSCSRELQQPGRDRSTTIGREVALVLFYETNRRKSGGSAYSVG